MSQIPDFDVEFDRPEAIYAAGETVTGRVVLSLSSPEDIKEIRWKASGVAATGWTERPNVEDTDRNTRWKTNWYGTKESYLEVSNRLVGTENDDERTTLEAGQYSYPFRFQLPNNIPCSFEHKYGQIRYSVEATVDQPWKFDRKVNSAFTVVASYDAIIQEGGTKPIRDEIVKKFLRCCCFSAGVMKMTVSSGESQFLPEEIVELIVSYNCTSTSIKITKMQLQLVKKMTFHDSDNKKLFSEVSKTVKNNEAFATRGETSLKIALPPSSNLEYCSIIDLDYELELIVRVSGRHSEITRTYAIKL